jgi:hypothetical protein
MGPVDAPVGRRDEQPNQPFKETIMLKKIAALAIAAGLVAGAASTASARNTLTDVDAHDSRYFTQHATPGSLLVISVVGDGDTDLDLIVRNRYGNTICSRTGPTDRETCRINVNGDGPFRIEVRNLGSVYNAFRLRATET